MESGSSGSDTSKLGLGERFLLLREIPEDLGVAELLDMVPDRDLILFSVLS